MLDSGDPPQGDFGACLEKIEREQPARAMQSHRRPHLSAGSPAGRRRSGSPAFSAKAR
jgi:hypothetical protein